MKSIFKHLLTFSSILLTLFLTIFSVFSIIVIKTTEDIDFQNIEVYSNSKIYDIYGNEITNLGLKISEYTSIENIAPAMLDAIISVEDANFYKHHGIDSKRILASIINNLKSLSFSQGASTINQQLIKNIYLSRDKTIQRKIREISLALKIDNELTKKQILEAYLNNILFGGCIYGIKAASVYYFNKEPIDLTVDEAATLAGMVQLPNYYNPFKNLEASTLRRNVVLKLMHQNGYISQQELNHYQNINLDEVLEKGAIVNKQNYVSSYLDYMYDYLNQNTSYHYTDSSMKIKTYLEPKIQKELYNIVTNKYNQFIDSNMKCAIVVLDNATGGILGLVGNNNTDSLVINYANTRIQPGSTIKPILDYAPAIEYLQYTLASLINDEPYTYSNGTKLENWDHRYKGYITLRTALKESRNIPALKLFQEVGADRSLEFAKNLGIVPISNIYEAESIGGSTYGYTLLSLANAYLAFANLGRYTSASPIQSISNQIIQYKNDESFKTVMKPSTAFLINSVLHDIFKGSYWDLDNTYLMAKTGQTNYDYATLKKYNLPEGSTKDSLVIAYTKSITIGIWVGFEVLNEKAYMTSESKNIPQNIMKHLMDQFAPSNEYYDLPKNINQVLVCIDNNEVFLAGKNDYQNSFYEYFLEGTAPLRYKTDKYPAV